MTFKLHSSANVFWCAEQNPVCDDVPLENLQPASSNLICQQYFCKQNAQKWKWVYTYITWVHGNLLGLIQSHNMTNFSNYFKMSLYFQYWQVIKILFWKLTVGRTVNKLLHKKYSHLWIIYWLFRNKEHKWKYCQQEDIIMLNVICKYLIFKRYSFDSLKTKTLLKRDLSLLVLITWFRIKSLRG